MKALSGIDEQSGDFPECPNCGAKEYWAGYRDVGGGIVFCHDKGLVNSLTERKVSFHGKDDVSILDSITAMRCGDCRKRASKEIMKEVLDIGRRLFDKRGVQFYERVG